MIGKIVLEKDGYIIYKTTKNNKPHMFMVQEGNYCE